MQSGRSYGIPDGKNPEILSETNDPHTERRTWHRRAVGSRSDDEGQPVRLSRAGLLWISMMREFAIASILFADLVMLLEYLAPDLSRGFLMMG